MYLIIVLHGYNYSITNLATNTLTAADNKISNVSNIVKKLTKI